MEKYDEIIKLDGRDFLIVDNLKYKDKDYIFVHAIENDDIAILEEYVENNEKMVKSVDDSLFDLLLGLFCKQNIE